MASREHDVRRALRRLQALLLGPSPAERAARLLALRRSTCPLRGFGLGPDGRIDVFLLSNASDADLASLGIPPIPESVEGVEVVICRDADGAWDALVEARDDVVVGPGSRLSNAYSADWGSLAAVLSLGGRARVLGASHVLAPLDATPNPGDGVLVGGAPGGVLDAWSAIAAFSVVGVDVGVANTSLPPTTQWPDGTAFRGTRAYDPAAGPFTFFGATSGAQHGAGSAVSKAKVALNVPEVGPVSYGSPRSARAAGRLGRGRSRQRRLPRGDGGGRHGRRGRVHDAVAGARAGDRRVDRVGVIDAAGDGAARPHRDRRRVTPR
jgi:hypothetical protein